MARSILPLTPADLANLSPDLGTVLASATRTASVNSSDFVNPKFPGILVTVNITGGNSSGPTLTPAIEAKMGSGVYEDVLGAAAIAASTGAGVHSYIVYPGATTKARGDIVSGAPLSLPQDWRLAITQSSTRTRTYSAEAIYLA
jgi:hypothetical protein